MSAIAAITYTAGCCAIFAGALGHSDRLFHVGCGIAFVGVGLMWGADR